MATTDKPLTGLTASVKLGNEVIAYVSGFDLTLEKEIIEIISFGMYYKEKVPAIKDWSASIDGTVALATGSTQETLFNAFESGDAITISIYLDETQNLTGTAYVQSFNISGSPDDKLTLASELSGSGALESTFA